MEPKGIIKRKKEKIEHEFLKGFNRSSKVLEHKLGVNAARLLNMLIYKHNYWLDREELIDVNGRQAFYITIPNIQVETNLKKHSIKNALKILEFEKLIEIHKISIPAQNHYIVNSDEISKLEKNHLEKYEKWCKSVYVEAKNDRKRFNNRPKKMVETLCLPQLAENSPTCQLKINSLGSDFSTVTNNKITNNKITNNFTNRMNADEIDCDLSNYNDELIKLIDNVMETNDGEEKSDCIKELYCFLCVIYRLLRALKRQSKILNSLKLWGTIESIVII